MFPAAIALVAMEISKSQLTHSMEQGPSWDAVSQSASQEIPCFS